MSGVVKAVGKIFKPIVKVVKMLAPIILAAAAIYFTAGAALSATAAWGTVAGGFATGTLGLTGTMASVVGGAITFAGYGAVAGAAMSAITGKNVLKGMQMGALVGAVAGGAAGAAGLYSAAAPAVTEGTAVTGHVAADASVAPGFEAAAPGSTAVSSGPMSAIDTVGTGGSGMTSALGGTGTAAAPMTVAAAANPATTAGATGFFSNPIVAGGLVSGVGQGIGAFASSKVAQQTQQSAIDNTSANYGTPSNGTGNTRITMGSAQQSGGAGNPAPAQLYNALDPANVPGHYVVDPESGQVVFVRNAANLVANPQSMGTKV